MFRFRPLAWLLIVLTVLGTTGSWHVDAADPDCAPLTVHDHSAHHERFTAQTSSSAPVHCALCHWLQAFRSDDVPCGRVVEDPGARVARVAPAARFLRALVLLELPPRAPPAA